MKTNVKLVLLFVILVPSIGFSQNGLVGYWSFDSLRNGQIIDESQLNNNARVFEASYTKGIKGNGLRFYGQDSYAQIRGYQHNIPENLKKLGVGSISIWFKVNEIPLEHGIAPIFYYGSNEKCDFYDAANKGMIIEVGHSPIYPRDENLFFTIWRDGCTYPSFCFDSNKRIVTGEWYHFVAVVGKDFNTGYLNGKELYDRNYNFGYSGDSQFFEDAQAHEVLWLGRGHWDRTTQFLDGSIDELKIFDKPLNEAQVLELFNEGDIQAITDFDLEPEPRGPYTRVYPNPASEMLFINLNDLLFTPEMIKISNLNGFSEIYTDIHICTSGIDISNFTPGFYNVQILGKSESKSKKIIIQR